MKHAERIERALLLKAHAFNERKIIWRAVARGGEHGRLCAAHGRARRGREILVLVSGGRDNEHLLHRAVREALLQVARARFEIPRAPFPAIRIRALRAQASSTPRAPAPARRRPAPANARRGAQDRASASAAAHPHRRWRRRAKPALRFRAQARRFGRARSRRAPDRPDNLLPPRPRARATPAPALAGSGAGFGVAASGAALSR